MAVSRSEIESSQGAKRLTQFRDRLSLSRFASSPCPTRNGVALNHSVRDSSSLRISLCYLIPDYLPSPSPASPSQLTSDPFLHSTAFTEPDPFNPTSNPSTFHTNCFPKLIGIVSLVEMGMKHREYLTSDKIFGCHCCRTHLSTIECVLSKVSPFPFFS